MNPLFAVLAADLGSMLADLLAGYMSYTFGTLVIKAGVACIASFVFRRLGRGKSACQTLVAMIAAGILAEAFMVLGCFTYEVIILGMGMGAAGAIIGNIGQGVVGVIVAGVVSPVLMRSYEITELVNRRYRNLYPIAIAAIADGTINVEQIVTHEFRFEESKLAFETVVKDAKNVVKGIIIL